MQGSSSSMTVIVNVHELSLPHISNIVYSTVVIPTGYVALAFTSFV